MNNFKWIEPTKQNLEKYESEIIILYYEYSGTNFEGLGVYDKTSELVRLNETDSYNEPIFIEYYDVIAFAPFPEYQDNETCR